MDKQRNKVVYPFVKRRPREEAQTIIQLQNVYVFGSTATGINALFLIPEIAHHATTVPIKLAYIQVRNVVTASLLSETIITTGSAVRVD